MKLKLGALLIFGIFSFGNFCQADALGSFSMTLSDGSPLPASITAGQQINTKLNFTISGSEIAGYAIDIINNPLLVSIVNQSDITAGNFPNALFASNNNYTDPFPIESRQISRIAAVTSNTGIMGSLVLANIKFTGIAAIQCRTALQVNIVDMITSTGSKIVFSPPLENLTIYLNNDINCISVAPSAPMNLSVL
ncbi:MAG: hypothetical protein WCI36_01905 [bacterium]